MSGPHDLEQLRAMLGRGEISLMHEALVDGRWVSVEELIEQRQKPTAVAKPTVAAQGSASLTPVDFIAGGPTSPQPPQRPPPPPAEDLFHVAKGGQQQGPYTKSVIRQLVAGGVLSSDDLAWKEGMPEWMPLGRMMADLPRPSPSRPPSPIVGGGAFSPPPTPPVSPVPPTTVAPDGGASGAVAGGYICALISLLLFPPFFALAAFVCAVVALVKGKIGHGVAIIILSLVCGIIGMAIGAAVTGR